MRFEDKGNSYLDFGIIRDHLRLIGNIDRIVNDLLFLIILNGTDYLPRVKKYTLIRVWDNYLRLKTLKENENRYVIDTNINSDTRRSISIDTNLLWDIIGVLTISLGQSSVIINKKRVQFTPDIFVTSKKIFKTLFQSFKEYTHQIENGSYECILSANINNEEIIISKKNDKSQYDARKLAYIGALKFTSGSIAVKTY